MKWVQFVNDQDSNHQTNWRRVKTCPQVKAIHTLDARRLEVLFDPKAKEVPPTVFMGTKEEPYLIERTVSK